MISSFGQVISNIRKHGGTYAEVHNPSYVYPPVEYYPLAAPNPEVSVLKAALMDMDGTTTTTEVLCVHSLEMMMRRMSGRMTREDWKGIDHDQDLQHIIGNSTTKHVEYLLEKYADLIVEAEATRSFITAACETFWYGNDDTRKAEVMQNIKKLGVAPMIDDMCSGTGIENIISKYAGQIRDIDFAMLTGMGIDIYYATYHRILAQLKAGKANEVKEEVTVFTGLTGKLIAPMPGISLLIPLIKGWLGAEAAQFAEGLFREYAEKTGTTLDDEQKPVIRKKLADLGKAFEESPVKVGLVTSSIAFEADIVIREVLKEMTDTIAQSGLSSHRKDAIMHAYEDYQRVYDAFVTATDSSEIRLKPHRDLYSIALHRIGVMPADFDKVIGFEDSQSGTVAIRAAGIGCCVAVPFAQTALHNLEAATHVLHGGIPQAIVEYGLFARNATSGK
ncbi:MAG: hypothetical protein R6U62_02725 [Bacteroidales bacterium]